MDEWRIHIGAHKTATTHLQYTLDAMAARLVAHSIQYVPTKELRLRGFPRRAIRAGAWLPKLSYRLMHKRTAALIRESANFQSFVLSEENILGDIESLFGLQYYPEAAGRLRFLSASAERRNLKVFLSIRRQDDVAASAYSEVLRVRPLSQPFRAFVEPLLDDPPSWYDLLMRVKGALPAAEVKVWCFEDYIAGSAGIFHSLTGCSDGDIPDVKPPSETQSLPAEAIALIEALDSKLPRDRYRKAVSGVVDSVKNGTKFDPFSPKERRRFAEIYASDVRRIKAQFPEVFVCGR
jgi:hypothetical protein